LSVLSSPSVHLLRSAILLPPRSTLFPYTTLFRSSGKGTIAGALAKAMGWHLLDSGAIYRVLGFYAQQQGISLSDEAALLPLAEQLPVVFKQNEQGGVSRWLEDAEVGNTIRTEAVCELASQVAVLPAVRRSLL